MRFSTGEKSNKNKIEMYVNLTSKNNKKFFKVILKIISKNNTNGKEWEILLINNFDIIFYFNFLIISLDLLYKAI